MDNEKVLTKEEVITRTLSIIKEIDILMETEKDQTRLMFSNVNDLTVK
jgi:hypothetical protein